MKRIMWILCGWGRRCGWYESNIFRTNIIFNVIELTIKWTMIHTFTAFTNKVIWIVIFCHYNQMASIPICAFIFEIGRLNRKWIGYWLHMNEMEHEKMKMGFVFGFAFVLLELLVAVVCVCVECGMSCMCIKTVHFYHLFIAVVIKYTKKSDKKKKNTRTHRRNDCN